MPIFKVYNPKEDQKVEPTIYLKLKEQEDEVKLMVCHANGSTCWQGHLLTLNRNGTIYLARCINPEFGFQLDTQQRIIQE